MKLILNRQLSFDLAPIDVSPVRLSGVEYIKTRDTPSWGKKLSVVCCVCKKARQLKIVGDFTIYHWNRKGGYGADGYGADAALRGLLILNSTNNTVRVGNLVDSFGDLAVICETKECVDLYKFAPIGWDDK